MCLWESGGEGFPTTLLKADKVDVAGSDSNSLARNSQSQEEACSRAPPLRQQPTGAFPKPSPACWPLDHTLFFPRPQGLHCPPKHKSLHIGVRCSTTALKPRRTRVTLHLPLASGLRADSHWLLSVHAPCRRNQQKMLQTGGTH